MAYIYKITNDINQKVYVGKTQGSIEKRFAEHCRDAFRERNEKRPLYAAMRKYGIEHFHITCLEETDDPNERERYWIEQLRSFHYGYNATMGGDGKAYLNYDLIIETYRQVQNITKTAKICGCSPDSVSNILHGANEKVLSGAEISHANGFMVNQYDLNGNYLQTFASARDAARAVKGDDAKGGIISHITDVCKGKRKTAYGYRWEYTAP